VPDGLETGLLGNVLDRQAILKSDKGPERFAAHGPFLEESPDSFADSSSFRLASFTWALAG
jgi:hypothetical protein